MLNKPIVKQFIEGEDRDYYYHGVSYILYEHGMIENEYQLDIHGKDHDTTIRFRNVASGRPEAALQFTVESYKEDIAGRRRTTRNDFSLPVEMIQPFIDALQNDRTWKKEDK